MTTTQLQTSQSNRMVKPLMKLVEKMGCSKCVCKLLLTRQAGIPERLYRWGCYSYTLSELAEMGLIKITIKESPSGNFNNLVNTIIEQ